VVPPPAPAVVPAPAPAAKPAPAVVPVKPVAAVVSAPPAVKTGAGGGQVVPLPEFPVRGADESDTAYAGRKEAWNKALASAVAINQASAVGRIELNNAIAKADAEGDITLSNALKKARQLPEAEAQGAITAKPVNQWSNAQDVYQVTKQINDVLPKATNGYVNAKIDDILAIFGKSTNSAQASAQLAVLGDKILKSVPRFSGPQSDKDVATYKAAAGQLSDRMTPIATRAAAFKTIMDLNKKYAPDLDWSFGAQQSDVRKRADEIIKGK
jgi:hypothetical protein